MPSKYWLKCIFKLLKTVRKYNYFWKFELENMSIYEILHALDKYAVFMLTHLPEARDKSNWIQTSENYERICLNK